MLPLSIRVGVELLRGEAGRRKSTDTSFKSVEDEATKSNRSAFGPCNMEGYMLPQLLRLVNPLPLKKQPV